MIVLGVVLLVVGAAVVALIRRGGRPKGDGAVGGVVTLRLPRERRTGPGWLRGSRGGM